MSSGLTEESAKFATIGIGCIMVNISFHAFCSPFWLTQPVRHEWKLHHFYSFSSPLSSISLSFSFFFSSLPGCNDARLDSTNGQDRSSHAPSLWTGWNVYLLDLHHHLLPHKGKHKLSTLWLYYGIERRFFYLHFESGLDFSSLYWVELKK